MVKIIKIDFCMEVKFIHGALINLYFQSICVPSVYLSARNITGAQKIFVKGMPDCMNKLINTIVIFKN